MGSERRARVKNQDSSPRTRETWPQVAIVILNWNGYEDTRECLESLRKITYPNYEVIVVDNGSNNGSGKQLQREYPHHHFVFNKKNLGYAAGNNKGIEKALSQGAKYVYILNNDTMIKDAPLLPLISAMENDPEIGIAGGTLYDDRNTERIQNTGQYINFYLGNVTTINAGELDSLNSDDNKKQREVDFICGAAMMINSEVFERIGFFDEKFFLVAEEADLCLRAWKAGFKVVYVPESKVIHKGKATVGRIPESHFFYTIRNKIWLVYRHGTAINKIAFTLYFITCLFPKIFAGRILRGQSLLLIPLLRAAFEGFFQVPGDRT